MDTNTVVLSLDTYHELLQCKHLVEEKYDVTYFSYGAHAVRVRNISGDEVIKELEKINDELNDVNKRLIKEIETGVKDDKPYFSFLK